MSYTYKDFQTGKIRQTQGRFVGWTAPTGLLGARYAIFARPRSQILVPEYLLSPESKTAIAKAEGRKA
jgi:hypothetical protein